jgi:hypothetical protein
MTNQIEALTEKQISWAADHDWFGSHNEDGTITIFDRYTQNGQYFEQMLVWNKSFRELRIWAGY